MATGRDLGGEERVVHILYLLHALAPFTLWLLAAIAVVIGMAKRADVSGTYLESHISWLSRTFWWGIAVGCLATLILVLTVVGILVWWLPWTILFLWYLYRVIRGWLRLNDRQPV
jgi:uncharacterized membrane protein